MRGIVRKLLVFSTLSVATAGAQNIGFGVRGGTPLTDFLRAESQVGSITNVVRGKGNVIIGPMLDLRLPLGLGIEADALYRRWDSTGVLSTGSRSTWEFPVYGKLRMPGIVVRPYVGAGINFQRLGDVRQLLGGTLVEPNRRGFLAAGGLELKIPLVRVSPEIRYTRWPDNGPIRSTHQLDFLIGLSF